MAANEYYNPGSTASPQPSGPPPPYHPYTQSSQPPQNPPPPPQHQLSDSKMTYPPPPQQQQQQPYYGQQQLSSQPPYPPPHNQSYNGNGQQLSYQPQQYPPPAETGSLRPAGPAYSYSHGPPNGAPGYYGSSPQQHHSYMQDRPASAAPYVEEPRRHHHRHHHDRSRSHSRDRDLDRDRGHHRHRRSSEQKRSAGKFDTFVGAGGGAIIGDAIFPGLGTVGGAILGGLGGHAVAKDKRSRSQGGRHKDRYEREWEASQHGGSQHGGRY